MSRKLSILMVTPHHPYPPHTGGKTRMFEQIKYFGQRTDLTVISFILSPDDYYFSHKIGEYCKESIVILWKNESSYPIESLIPESIHEWFMQDMYDAIKGFKTFFVLETLCHQVWL